jgi:hypothetical protein
MTPAVLRRARLSRLLLLAGFCVLTAILLASCGKCRHFDRTKTDLAPDCIHEGYRTVVCNDCGYTYTCDYVAPLGHQMETVVTPPTC